MKGFRVLPDMTLEPIEQVTGIPYTVPTKIYYINSDYYCNLTTPKFESNIRSYLKYAFNTKCRGIIVRLPSRNNSPSRIVRCIKEVLHLFTPETKLIIENSYDLSHFGTNIRDLYTIWCNLTDEEKTKVAYCLNPSHYHLAGYTMKTRMAIIEQIGKFHEIIGLENLALFHLNDVVEQPFTDYREIWPILRGICYTKESIEMLSNIIYYFQIPFIFEKRRERFFLHEEELLIRDTALNKESVTKLLEYRNAHSYLTTMKQLASIFNGSLTPLFDRMLANIDNNIPKYRNNFIRMNYEDVVMSNHISNELKMELLMGAKAIKDLPIQDSSFIGPIPLKNAIVVYNLITSLPVPKKVFGAATRYSYLNFNQRVDISNEALVENKFHIIINDHTVKSIKNDFMQYIPEKFKIYKIVRLEEVISVYIFKVDKETNIFASLYIHCLKDLSTEKRIMTELILSGPRDTEQTLTRAAHLAGYTLEKKVLKWNDCIVKYDTEKELLGILKIGFRDIFNIVF